MMNFPLTKALVNLVRKGATVPPALLDGVDTEIWVQETGGPVSMPQQSVMDAAKAAIVEPKTEPQEAPAPEAG
jgi:hypothetical protein